MGAITVDGPTISAEALPLIADAFGASRIDAPGAFDARGLGLPAAATPRPDAIPLRQFARLMQCAGDASDAEPRLWLSGRAIAAPSLGHLFPEAGAERRLGALLARTDLRLSGLIDVTDKAARLTDRGEREGARVTRNHRLWEQYLITYADVAPSHVDFSADYAEHALSPELTRELEAALAERGRLPETLCSQKPQRCRAGTYSAAAKGIWIPWASRSLRTFSATRNASSIACSAFSRGSQWVW